MAKDDESIYQLGDFSCTETDEPLVQNITKSKLLIST